jgi:hypothetical protein
MKERPYENNNVKRGITKRGGLKMWRGGKNKNLHEWTNGKWKKGKKLNIQKKNRNRRKEIYNSGGRDTRNKTGSVGIMQHCGVFTYLYLHSYTNSMLPFQ